MKKDKVINDPTKFLCEVFVTKNTFPHQLDLGNKGTSGDKFNTIRVLVIKRKIIK